MKKRILSILFLVIPMATFAQEKGLDQQIDEAFKPISDFFSQVIFFTIPIAGIDVPFVLLLLVGSALFFTIYFKFPNIFHFKTAINVVRGKYDELDHASVNSELAIDKYIADTIKDESKEGEVTHFQALATAVSGTVGNGNIAGVALAIALGGQEQPSGWLSVVFLGCLQSLLNVH